MRAMINITNFDLWCGMAAYASGVVVEVIFKNSAAVVALAAHDDGKFVIFLPKTCFRTSNSTQASLIVETWF
jgi:hypothetical protein